MRFASAITTAAFATGLGAVLVACGDDSGSAEGLFGSAESEGGSGSSPSGGGAESNEGSGGSGSAADGADDSSDEGPKFDTPDGVSAGDDGGPGDCECGNSEWSYVFIANSQESTVAKINTRTLVEEGRYLTRADGNGNPSRTSVSIDGKAVAVANRHVGLLKIWARPELCAESNGMAGIQTSTGKDDVLPFGQDECVAWFTDFPDMTVERPVQWTPGEGECHQNQKIWTVTGTNGQSPGFCGPGGVWVHRVDGDTGVVEDTIHLDEGQFPCTVAILPNGTGVGVGIYGGAVDADGNFYTHGFDNGKFARVDFDTLNVEYFSGGGYGITVDTKGRAWWNGVSRFDYSTGMYQSAGVSGGSGGIAQDLQNRMWFANNTKGVTWVDMDSMALGDTIDLPEGPGWTVKGVSVDIDGFIWAVRQDETVAYKIDPDDYSIEMYDGLNGPYTYSDMTGGALANVTCNPPEG
ncbi:MAG TPA: hypothetical protein VG755_03405 [Nannocystaceae bacterium]|nr:hypothetical protein [Nannocystaceae bacterium]